MGMLGYDKRGVGRLTGEWKTESFDDLAGDAIAAVEFLKARRDIDPSQIGMLGTRMRSQEISQTQIADWHY